MRSWDPMRNYPELDSLPDAEAKALIVATQKRVSRQPAMLAGLIGSGLAGAVPAIFLVRPGGFISGAIFGGIIGLAMVAFMVLVIKPRIREEFRRMGYPQR